jgi:AcrR family transcriptional regulator
MTRYVKIVIVMRLTYADLEGLLETFSDEAEGTDVRGKKRRRILDAALSLFMRHGYRKTSVDDVARQAGVAKGTIYLYFKTKSDLMIQAIIEEKKRYIANLKPILEAPSEQRLELYLRLVFVLINEMPLMSKLLRGDREVLLVLEEMDTDLRQQALDFQASFLAQLLADTNAEYAQAPEELAARAQVLLGLIYASGILTDERIRKGLSVERQAELLSELIVEGVRARSTR